MEDILGVYQLPYNQKEPVLCLDEKPYNLHKDTISPLPMRVGSTKKIDYEYARNGHVSIFSIIEPLTGKQHVDARKKRTAMDFAEVVKWIVDDLYPEADKIILVLDNLNTHKVGSLYKRFKAPEANRIMSKLEFHYTPKHGNWLNIAEIGINILTRQCLSRRIPTVEVLSSELEAWCEERNKVNHKINWQFTTKDARIKLRSLYPKL